MSAFLGRATRLVIKNSALMRFVSTLMISSTFALALEVSVVVVLMIGTVEMYSH